MSDIVERLRASAEHSQKCGWLTHALLDRQAADEIERLNEDREKYFLENLEMKAEIERLLENQDPMQFEIERLRAEIEQLRADPDPGQRIWDDGYAAGKAACEVQQRAKPRQ